MKNILKERKEHYEIIVKKVMQTTYTEFMEQIRYLLRYSKNGPIHIIHQYFDSHVDDIKKKTVNELTEHERLILMVHWAYEHGGFDKFRATPFNIIENLTDAEIVDEFNRRCNSPHHSVRIETSAICRRNEE
jgi:hypothetical protein